MMQSENLINEKRGIVPLVKGMFRKYAGPAVTAGTVALSQIFGQGILQGTATANGQPVRNLQIIIENVMNPSYRDTIYSDNTGFYIKDDLYLSTSGGNDRSQMPKGFKLNQNFPNSFSNRTAIVYDIPAVAHPDNYELNIWNIKGLFVRQLTSENMNPGHYIKFWNGKNQFGKEVANGIYFFELRTPYGSIIKKCTRLKNGGTTIYSASGGVLSRVPHNNNGESPSSSNEQPIINSRKKYSANTADDNENNDQPFLDPNRDINQDYRIMVSNVNGTNPYVFRDTFLINISNYTTIFDMMLEEMNNVMISGNVKELLPEENIPIEGIIVTHGDSSSSTDMNGNYALLTAPGAVSRLILTHPEFYERQTSEFMALNDTTILESMIDTAFNMEHYDKICRSDDQGSSPGTQRWTTTPTVYLNINPAPNHNGDSTIVTQANIDTALSVIQDLPQFAYNLFPDGEVPVEIGTNPPWGQEGYMILLWDNTIPGAGEHYEHLDGNRIDYTVARMKTGAGRGVYVQELSQNLGARRDSNIIRPSILNEPPAGNYYYSVDLLVGKVLYIRPIGSLSIDKDK